MNIYKTDLFPYVAGDSLVGKPVTLTMGQVKVEAVTSNGKTDERPVLYFKETNKGLVLNKTNAKTIAQAYGGETEGWQGYKLELYSEKVRAFGKTHNAVRVRLASNGKAAQVEALQDEPVQEEPAQEVEAAQ